MFKYDFAGWATKNNLKCSDGRTILQDAFKHHDGKKVPLVWNHQHNDAENILGHAMLENRPEGVYAYCKFNDSAAGQNAKILVEHGDISALSIFANRLKQQGANVQHGIIREVSLVLAGANPGAYIESVMQHGDDVDDIAIIYTGEELCHSEGIFKEKEKLEEEESMNNELQHKDRTVQDVVDEMTEEQKNVLYALVGQALESNEAKHGEDLYEDENTIYYNGGDGTMKHNIFENEVGTKNDTLSHDEMQTIIGDAKRYGSMKESFLAHADAFGITNIDFLFPDYQTLQKTPDFISRDMDWVAGVMAACHKSPFSRIKTIHADITEDEARALGYIKGNLKKEEVFSLLKRTTDPQTIYKKQKLHRDDVIDITDFDVVAFLKAEMRMMLNEEIARAILIGDGRLASSDDKIQENHIRPVYTDVELYSIHKKLSFAHDADADAKAKDFIRGAVKARKDYKGSGNPTLYCSEDILTDCLLLEDGFGRRLYNNVGDLATAMRVAKIVTIPVMDNLSREVGGKELDCLGIIVNLKDYNIGADKGGAINMFDDFDIDYNQQKYLIETRCSGALTKPYSAIVLEAETLAAPEDDDDDNTASQGN